MLPAMAGIDYTIDAKTAGFHSAIGGALGKLKGLAGSVASIAAPVAAIGGIAGLTAGLGKAIGKAAEMETLETAFQPLLGSAAAAEERIAALAQFAADTPFELPQIAAASKTLETLTKGALSTGEGLTLVGDVAAATGKPFDEIATTVGRLYDGLDSGRPVGEALARLQELGVISGDARGQLEALQDEGVKGADAWAVAEAAMGKFSGGMKLQSGTWNGLLSTVKDNIGNAFAAFGTPIIDTLKPYLASAADTAGTMAKKAAEFGQKVGETIRFVAAAFSTGNVTTILAEGLKLGFMNAVNFLWKSLRATIASVGQYLLESFRNAVTYFEVLTSADFWKGMGNAIVGVFLGAVAFLQKGIAEALEVARPLAELFGKGDSIDVAQKDFRDASDILNAEAAERFASAGDQLGPLAEKVAARWKEAGENIAASYQETFAATADVMDPSGARAKLDAAFTEIRDTVAANAAAAETTAQSVAAAVETETPETSRAADPASAGAARQVSADRLAQIGGYVGAAAKGLAERAAEKTAAGMMRAVKSLESIDRRLANPQPAGATF